MRAFGTSLSAISHQGSSGFSCIRDATLTSLQATWLPSVSAWLTSLGLAFVSTGSGFVAILSGFVSAILGTIVCVGTGADLVLFFVGCGFGVFLACFGFEEPDPILSVYR